MNDKSQRIYNLAKEAGLIEFEPLSWNPNAQVPTPESVVKARIFAELIIRECIACLEFHGYDEAIPYIEHMAVSKLGVLR